MVVECICIPLVLGLCSDNLLHSTHSHIYGDQVQSLFYYRFAFRVLECILHMLLSSVLADVHLHAVCPPRLPWC